MKQRFMYVALLLVLAGAVVAQTKTLYDFTVESIDGESYAMSQLKGKKVLIVNVASKCGLTPQYEKLQVLYDTYKAKNFVVVAFPANNFMQQEPGTNAEIREFCTNEFNITFPIMAKISVKGDDMAPLYGWLTQKKENGVLDSAVSWNFQKFLINEQGHLVNSISPRVDPMDKQIVDWIEGASK